MLVLNVILVIIVIIIILLLRFVVPTISGLGYCYSVWSTFDLVFGCILYSAVVCTD